MEKEQLIKATQILQKHIPNRFPLQNPNIDAMQEYAEWYHKEQSKKCSIPAVVGQSEQLIAFSKWKEEKGYNPIYDHKGLVEEYLKSN